jgi:hypothetical protein
MASLTVAHSMVEDTTSSLSLESLVRAYRSSLVKKCALPIIQEDPEEVQCVPTCPGSARKENGSRISRITLPLLRIPERLQSHAPALSPVPEEATA